MSGNSKFRRREDFSLLRDMLTERNVLRLPELPDKVFGALKHKGKDDMQKDIFKRLRHSIERVRVQETEETADTFRYKLLPKKKYKSYRYGWFSQEKGIQVLYGIDSGGSKISTIVFHKKKGWTKDKAEKWLDDKNYRYEKMENTGRVEDLIIARQRVLELEANT